MASSIFKFFDMLVDLEIVLGRGLGGKMRIRIWAEILSWFKSSCKEIMEDLLKKFGVSQKSGNKLYTVAYGTLCRSMTKS